MNHNNAGPTDRATTEALLELARTLAVTAGAFLLDGQHRPRMLVESKSSATDLVSEMDRQAETMIVQGIVAARPNDGIIGEEGTDRKSESGIRWAIDPLDGTVNYLYGLPMWSVSIGAIDGEGSIVGVVAIPALREVYSARRGGGAWRSVDGAEPERLAVSEQTDLGHSLVATGFSYNSDIRTRQASVIGSLLPTVRDLRRNGAAAVDLCWVAGGRMDAYYEHGTHIWDRAAGQLLVEEAGGRTSDAAGSEPSDTMILATNGVLHNTLADLVRWR